MNGSLLCISVTLKQFYFVYEKCHQSQNSLSKGHSTSSRPADKQKELNGKRCFQLIRGNIIWILSDVLFDSMGLTDMTNYARGTEPLGVSHR